eukprot:scaffold32912_cov60-Phaeocystis_antarctica.AAC.1
MSEAISRCARPESTRATPSAPFSQPMSAATPTGRTMSWMTCSRGARGRIMVWTTLDLTPRARVDQT